MRNFYVLFFVFTSLFGFGQDFQWARQFSGMAFENADAIDVDGNGNSYVFGTTQSHVFDLNTDSNATQIVDNSANTNHSIEGAYLVKNDRNGNFVWGKIIGNYFTDKAIDMQIGSDGNIYLLAMIREYNSALNFYPNYITIVKLDPNGNELLRKKYTNHYNPNSYDDFSAVSFDLDNQNNIFITGYYNYNLKLDPVNPAFNLNAGKDSFLLKLNANADLIWTKKFNVHYLNYHFEDVNVRNDGNIILVISNGDYPNPQNYGYKVFNINSNDGSVLWEKFLENQNPVDLTLDSNDNIIIIGHGTDLMLPIDVDPSSNNHVIDPRQYLLWLNSNGDFLDVKSYNSIWGIGNNFFLRKVQCDTNNTFLIGDFYGSFDADPSSNTFNLNNTCISLSSSYEGFSIKFDNSRNFESAFNIGGYTNYCSQLIFSGVKIINNEHFYIGSFGGIGGTVDLDLSNNNYLLTNYPTSHSADAFILKLSDCDSRTPVGDPNQYFCSNQNSTVADLLPNSNSIKWYNSLTSTTQLAATTPLIDGQIYYAVKQETNCPESPERLAVTVHIQQTPQVPVISNQTFCENDNATISSLIVSGQNLSWYNTATAGNTLSPATVLQNNVTYYASQTINNCESERTAVTVTIIPNQPPTSNSLQSFCIQQNATINNISVTGQNIQWYDAPNGGNLLANTTPLQNGMTYYASQTINGCESTRVPVAISIQNTPAPTGNATQSFCSSQNATLSDIAISGSNLIWYDSAVGSVILSSSTLLADNSTYYVTQTINGCESTRFAVTVTLIDTLNANDYAETLCDDLNNGSEIIDLSDYNALVISNTTNTVFTYYTSSAGAENQTSSGLITNYNNYNLTIGTHIIYVRIDSSNGCHQVVALQLTLVSKPISPISNTMALCDGTSITVSAGTGFDSYLWSTNEISPSITITAPGTYSVTVCENHGTVTCCTVKNFTVVNSNIATISEVITTDWTYNQNTITVLLTGNNTNDYMYSLDDIHYQSDNTFSGLQSGGYTVYVKNLCGVKSEDFYLLMYPKFFTPNGDGYNDYWKIRFSEKEADLEVKIFDRYGKFIKQIGYDTPGWDGTYLGRPVPSDDYWFQVTRKNGKEHRGHFTLKR
nr:T9SS type B sorting domain-containing protein [uncultured Flavobacterium sp.]